MLAEAYAEQEWLKLETARESVQEMARKSFTDKRLPPVERARLGARGTIFGSQAVNRMFNEANAEAFTLLLSSRTGNDPDAIQLLVECRDLWPWSKLHNGRTDYAVLECAYRG